MHKSESTISIQEKIPQIIKTYSIEFSVDQNIFYCAGRLQFEKARTSCPVVIVNSLSGSIEGKLYLILLLIKEILETENTLWIFTLKRFSNGNIQILAVAGDKHIISFYQILSEEPGNVKIGKL